VAAGERFEPGWISSGDDLEISVAGPGAAAGRSGRTQSCGLPPGNGLRLGLAVAPVFVTGEIALLEEDADEDIGRGHQQIDEEGLTQRTSPMAQKNVRKKTA
jgi:hypothetical protein